MSEYGVVNHVPVSVNLISVSSTIGNKRPWKKLLSFRAVTHLHFWIALESLSNGTYNVRRGARE